MTKKKNICRQTIYEKRIIKKKKENYCRHIFYNEDLRKVYVYNKVIIL